ncbi:hypothetical protein HERIO_2439 [Hepatospora eriocheir]|uniref:Uncharacterized protein n=1 Tax=Hepatospora eriocheir TaxID=1081669 RepID=A0A1X0Q6Z1_9MICR|nr:hypothetical protein HERIO_2439 [Hepatospora eriocheir]
MIWNLFWKIKVLSCSDEYLVDKSSYFTFENSNSCELATLDKVELVNRLYDPLFAKLIQNPELTNKQNVFFSKSYKFESVEKPKDYNLKRFDYTSNTNLAILNLPKNYFKIKNNLKTCKNPKNKVEKSKLKKLKMLFNDNRKRKNNNEVSSNVENCSKYFKISDTEKSPGNNNKTNDKKDVDGSISSALVQNDEVLKFKEITKKTYKEILKHSKTENKIVSNIELIAEKVLGRKLTLNPENDYQNLYKRAKNHPLENKEGKILFYENFLNVKKDERLISYYECLLLEVVCFLSLEHNELNLKLELDVIKEFTEILNRSLAFINYYDDLSKIIDLINKDETNIQELVNDLITTFKQNIKEPDFFKKDSSLKCLCCFNYNFLRSNHELIIWATTILERYTTFKLSEFEDINVKLKSKDNDVLVKLKVISILHINSIFRSHKNLKTDLKRSVEDYILRIKVKIRNNFLKVIKNLFETE